jgi:hypothetical protein
MLFHPFRTTVAVAAVSLSGCQGTLMTKPATESERAGAYEGIKFYPTTLMQEVSQTTVLIDKNGKIIATAANSPGSGKYCQSVVSSKAIVAADFSRPMIVYYKPGLLEAYTFNPTITDGMLGALSVASAPDQGKTIASLASAAGALAPLLEHKSESKPTPPAKPPTGVFACTDGIVVISRTPLLPTYTAAPTSGPSTGSPSEAINFKTPTLTPISE